MQESALWRGNKKFRDWFERYWRSKSDVSLVFLITFPGKFLLWVEGVLPGENNHFL